MTTSILETPKTITSLATSAVLVAVEVHSTTFTKKDRKMAAEVSAERGARTVAGSWEHELFVGDTDLEALLAFRPTIYNWVKRLTYPWGGGYYILPMVNYTRFMSEFEEMKKEYEVVRLEKFLSRYEEKINAMAFARGPMFNRADYPDIDTLRGAYSVELSIANVPLGDFRVSVAQDLANDLQRTFEEQAQRKMTELSDRLSAQFVDVMDALSRGCTNEIVEGKDGKPKVKRGRLFESAVERALELCSTFREFNPTGNTLLEDARQRLSATLADVTTDQLRHSDSLRERVKSDVDDILSIFKARR